LSGRGRSAKRGFTLVEVIVVLVILAILAAIAIPALTGYIDKAEDKKYIAMARNAAVAVRTVMDQAYADDELDLDDDYFKKGGPQYQKFKCWDVNTLSPGSMEEAAALLGETMPVNESGTWDVQICGPLGDESTPLNTDGFLYMRFIDSPAADSPEAVLVAYNVNIDAAGVTTTKGVNGIGGKINTTATYDANAGYVVYHLIYNGW
jgi:prepilin-type N-terminal cleavage/methylation domain-containing protein